MPGTTPNLAIRYPLATEAPDGPGAVLAAVTDVDNILKGQSWIPTLTGGNGATIGANPAVSGRHLQIGKYVWARGRITFGSSASFGVGAAAIGGMPGDAMDVYASFGYGFYTNGTVVTPLQFIAVDGANMQIKPVMSNGASTKSYLGYGYDLGTPPQSTTMYFNFDITLS